MILKSRRFGCFLQVSDPDEGGPSSAAAAAFIRSIPPSLSALSSIRSAAADFHSANRVYRARGDRPIRAGMLHRGDGGGMQRGEGGEVGRREGVLT